MRGIDLTGHDVTRWLMRAMLVALAATAAAGVVGLLFGFGTLGWIVVGMTGGLAVTTLLLARFVPLLDKPQFRNGAIFALGLIAFQYLFLVVILWSDLWVRSTYALWLTKGVVWAAGLSIVGALHIHQRPADRIAGYVALAVCTLFGILLLGGTWISGYDHLYLMAGQVWYSGLLMVAALVKSPGRHPWRWIGVAASAVMLIYALQLGWNDRPFLIPGWYGPVASVALIVAYINIALLVPLKGAQRLVRIAGALSLIAAAPAVNLLGYEMITDPQMDEWLTRVVAALLLVCICCSIGMLVLARLNRTPSSISRDLPEIRSAEVQCPLCKTMVTTPVSKLAENNTVSGPSATCPTCRAEIRVQVQVPQCVSCGYLLYMLEGDTCPECGTPAAAGAELASPAHPG